MNKAQRKIHIKYLNVRRKQAKPKQVLIRKADTKKRKMLGLLLAYVPSRVACCDTCIYKQPRIARPRSQYSNFKCIKCSRHRNRYCEHYRSTP